MCVSVCVFVSVLTHEQLAKLKQIAKTNGVGVQGHQRSIAENAVIVRCVGIIQQKGFSLNESINQTAELCMASTVTVRSLFNEYGNTNQVHEPQPRAEIDRNDPLHPFYFDCGPSPQAIDIICTNIDKIKDNNNFESLSTIQLVLKEASIDVSKTTLHRWFKALKYTYGKKHFTTATPAYRNSLIQKYIYKYAKALKQQEDGTHVIVYMDESYVHSHHCTTSFWHKYSNFLSANYVRGDNRGKRLIIMHAMTKYGLLAVENVEPSNVLEEIYHSCALIFNEVYVNNVAVADYHDTINGAKFTEWIQTRLLPTFEAMFPNKKMVLVLDNAKYHHHRGPEWFSPSGKKKGVLADWIRQIDPPITQFTADDGRVFMRNKFSADATRRGGGPTNKQLEAFIKQYIAAHPGINTTVPHQLLSDKGHRLLYTPPYISDLQPIELIWAFTKHLVARQSHRSRSVHDAAVQTRKAMDEVTAELCGKVVQHCHKWIDSFMRTDDAGSLKQFTDLNTLTHSQFEIPEIVNNSSESDSESEEDS